MIPLNSFPWESGLWQTLLAKAYRSPAELVAALKLTPPTTELLLGGAQTASVDSFPMLVPRGFAARMTPGDWHDPLLRQVLPTQAEHELVEGYVSDPLAETIPSAIRSPGLIQKYHGRALLIATPACAVHCRYCFRKHFPYAEHRPKFLRQAIQAIKNDASIREIILSGGDPLLLDDDQLTALLTELDAMPHIMRIRLHSRLPIVLPERTTEALANTLEQLRCQSTLVVHANHPRELDDDTQRAFTVFKQAGVTLLNQSVLLAGVNDHARTQIELAERLFQQGVLPYYLHMPDAVTGTHHFDVPWARAQEIYGIMQAELPGYLLARLVKEEPGANSKTALHFGPSAAQNKSMPVNEALK